MTPAEQAAAAQELIDQLAPIVDDVPHRVVLCALLSMFRTTALHHGCCATSAAMECVQVALDLRRSHQEQTIH